MENDDTLWFYEVLTITHLPSAGRLLAAASCVHVSVSSCSLTCASDPQVWCQEGFYPSEPVFVPSPGAHDEDDGVVLSVALTPSQVRSHTGPKALRASRSGNLCSALGQGNLPPGFGREDLPGAGKSQRARQHALRLPWCLPGLCIVGTLAA